MEKKTRHSVLYIAAFGVGVWIGYANNQLIDRIRETITPTPQVYYIPIQTYQDGRTPPNDHRR